MIARMAARQSKRSRPTKAIGSQPPARNVPTVAPDRLQRVRTICLALQGATEKLAWGDPTWRVRGRIFAMQKGNVAGHRPSLWLKAPDGVQGMLVEGDPSVFFVPPYVGKNGWIGIHLDGRSLDWAMLADLVEQSHRLIAPRRRGR